MLNKLKVTKLAELIGEADIINIVCDGSIDTAEVQWVDEFENDPENQLVLLEWVNDDNKFYTHLTEQGLNDATFENGVLTLEDHEGNPVRLELYKVVPVNIEQELQTAFLNQ